MDAARFQQGSTDTWNRLCTILAGAIWIQEPSRRYSGPGVGIHEGHQGIEGALPNLCVRV